MLRKFQTPACFFDISMTNTTGSRRLAARYLGKRLYINVYAPIYVSIYGFRQEAFRSESFFI